MYSPTSGIISGVLDPLGGREGDLLKEMNLLALVFYTRLHLQSNLGFLTVYAM